MSNSAGDHLSPLDALFVYLEKKEMPLHIGSVLAFDGPIAMDRLKALVESKLPLIPRYRQRLVFPPLHIGLPTWEWDPDFQLDRHFGHARLKHGTQKELEDLAGEHFAKMMDRGRPLWDVLLVDGLEGRRSAIMIRVHHCLVDGIAGVALMNILFDQSRTPPKLPKAQPFHAPPLPDTGKRFVDAIVNAYEEFTTRILAAQSEALNVAQAMLGQPPIDSLDQFPGALPFTAVERLPFNKPVLGPRQFAWTELPLDEVKAVKNALGGTVNDVVLMVVTAAVRRYCEYHGHSMRDRILRMMVPVNLRRDVINPGVGNSISFLPVNIPLDIADPVKLLHEVHRITESLKRGHVADVITLTAKWLGTAPAPFQVAFGLLGNNLPLPPWNMVCTNVPGPQVPLYALGRELLTAYPYVPIGNEMGMNCAVESYNGKLFVNFAGDTVAVPDIGRVRDLVVDSFRVLKDRAAAAAAGANDAAASRHAEPKKPGALGRAAVSEKASRARAKAAIPVKSKARQRAAAATVTPVNVIPTPAAEPVAPVEAVAQAVEAVVPGPEAIAPAPVISKAHRRAVAATVTPVDVILTPAAEPVAPVEAVARAVDAVVPEPEAEAPPPVKSKARRRAVAAPVTPVDVTPTLTAEPVAPVEAVAQVPGPEAKAPPPVKSKSRQREAAAPVTPVDVVPTPAAALVAPVEADAQAVEAVVPEPEAEAPPPVQSKARRRAVAAPVTPAAKPVAPVEAAAQAVDAVVPEPEAKAPPPVKSKARRREAAAVTAPAEIGPVAGIVEAGVAESEADAAASVKLDSSVRRAARKRSVEPVNGRMAVTHPEPAPRERPAPVADDSETAITTPAETLP